MSTIAELSLEQLDREIERVGAAWETTVLKDGVEAAEATYGALFAKLTADRQARLTKSAASVVRLRFLAGETGRNLDAACAEALGWRVSRDPWWNWHEGPRYDPPGDEWCIRKDGRNDLACNEALPHFTAESFEQALRAQDRRGGD